MEYVIANQGSKQMTSNITVRKVFDKVTKNNPADASQYSRKQHYFKVKLFPKRCPGLDTFGTSERSSYFNWFIVVISQRCILSHSLSLCVSLSLGLEGGYRPCGTATMSSRLAAKP